MTITNRRGFGVARLTWSAAAVLAALGSTSAWAFRIELENPDATLNWDTSVRYNLGWRMEDINPHFANAFGTDETETRFKKHDLITNRLDVFTEADYVVRTSEYRYGVRASAAAWKENAYDDTTHTGDLINSTFGAAAPTSNYGAGGQYSDYAKRYLTDQGGEFVDAFVFGGLNIGDNASVDLKLGQHNVYWGESMFSGVDSVAHAQGPIDTIKAATSPGVETKELFMPIQQVSGIWSLGNGWGVMGQYLYDWKPSRLSPGGTYFASSDSSTSGWGGDTSCTRVLAGGGCLIRSLEAVTPGRKGGDYGLAVRWMPEFIPGSTLAAYYRKYDDKLPSWSTLQNAGGGNLALRMAYARDIEMFGFSYGGRIGSVSTGMEASYRRNTPLNSVSALPAGGAGTVIPLSQMPTYEQAEGAVGNTYHFLINGTFSLAKNFLWETGAWVAEFAYQRLDKVTKNEHLFYSVDHACKNGFAAAGVPAGRDESDGCSSKESMQLAVSFMPQWMGALPSVDLTLPISVTYGLHGNPLATGGGTYEGAYRWSIGLKAVYKTDYEFGLALNDQHQDYKTSTGTASSAVPGEQVFSSGAGQSQVQNNHRWLSLRFKTTF